MSLDLYNVLRLVEEEIEEMKKRQQLITGMYQQQTREDLARKFAEAEHDILEIAEKKIKEINAIESGKPYLVIGNRKVYYISVRRIKNEDLTIEIDPIIYPTQFNLRFILNEPSVALYSPSSTKGILSLNSTTPIRSTDHIEPMEEDNLDQYLDLWITHNAEGRKSSTLSKKTKESKDSSDLLIELLLMLSSPAPMRDLIYVCEEHERDPEHIHERIVPPSAVKGVIKNHITL